MCYILITILSFYYLFNFCNVCNFTNAIIQMWKTLKFVSYLKYFFYRLASIACALSENLSRARFCAILSKIFLYLKSCAIFSRNLFLEFTSCCPSLAAHPLSLRTICSFFSTLGRYFEVRKSFNRPWWLLLVILKKIQSLSQINKIVYIALVLFNAQ